MGNVIVCCGEGPTSDAPSSGSRSVKIPKVSRSSNYEANEFVQLKRELSHQEYENKIRTKDNEMKLQNINYPEFEFLIKKYGYKGVVKMKQFQEAGLSKTIFKQSDL